MQSISDEHGIGGGHAYHMRNILYCAVLVAALKTRKWKNIALNHAAKYIGERRPSQQKCATEHADFGFTLLSENGEITHGETR